MLCTLRPSIPSCALADPHAVAYLCARSDTQTTLHVKFPDRLLAAVSRAADRRMQSRSEWLRQVAPKGLERDGLIDPRVTTAHSARREREKITMAAPKYE